MKTSNNKKNDKNKSDNRENGRADNKKNSNKAKKRGPKKIKFPEELHYYSDETLNKAYRSYKKELKEEYKTDKKILEELLLENFIGIIDSPFGADFIYERTGTFC